jgi:hypothetical protein
MENLDSESILEEIWFGSQGLHLIGSPCTYPHFQKLTPKSTLEEIWYGSQGLHLIGAPIYIFKNLVGLGQIHLALDESPIALTSILSRTENSTTLP